MKFLSTSSARRTTAPAGKVVHRSGISIHVLREEDDEHIADRYILVDVISIHVLREEDDLFFPVLRTQWLEFLSTSSARRTTV